MQKMPLQYFIPTWLKRTKEHNVQYIVNKERNYKSPSALWMILVLNHWNGGYEDTFNLY